MKHVVIIGAGVVGVATALLLARRGFQVSVIEKRQAVGQGCSFANAGLQSPGHAYSWAEPGAPLALFKSAFQSEQSLGFSRPFDPALWRWGLQFLRNCNRRRWHANSVAAYRLASLSRHVQSTELHIAPELYGATKSGILYLYRDMDEVRKAAHETTLLRAEKEEFSLLDRDQIERLEPMLADNPHFNMAIYCPNDATGNAHQFTEAAMSEASALGVQFKFGETVLRWHCRGREVLAVETDDSRVRADAFVLAAGVDAPQLVRSLGYRLPIFPVAGYSLTWQGIRAPVRPRVGAVSVRHKIAWSTFDDRIRFTGFADFGATPSKRASRRRFNALRRFAEDIVGGGSLPEASQSWIGARPMTPTGLPILGKSQHKNLYFNCGHGAMGWTMACGSAGIVADLLTGNEQGIDDSAYRWDA